jgi:hypothetical protein
MKKAAVLFVVLMVAGCHSNLSPKPDDGILKAEWQLAYAAKANNFTTRTYQCTTEMWTLKYEPVDSGLICKDSCRLFAEVNAMVNSAPSYVDNPKQYLLEGGICEPKKPEPQP